MQEHRHLLPALVYAAVVLPFVFDDVLNEGDLEAMANAVMYKAAAGIDGVTDLHYGWHFSFGYYALLELFPRSVLTDSASLILLINAVGYVSAVIALAFLGMYLRRVFDVRIAIAATTLFAFSPLFLQMGTYGHPIMPGLALFMVGAWALAHLEKQPWMGLVSIVCIAAALTMRSDLAFGLAFVGATGPREIRSIKALIRDAWPRVAIVTLALLVFLVVQSAVAHEQAAELADFMGIYYQDILKKAVKGAVVMALATGIAACIAAGYSLLRARRLSHRAIVAVACLIVPSVLFWLPNPTPARHLVFAVLGVAMLIALVFVDTRRLASMCIAIVLGNQLLAEVTNPIVVAQARGGTIIRDRERAVYYAPFGALPLDQTAMQAKHIQFRDEGKKLARSCSGRVVMLMDSKHYMLMSLLDVDPQAKIRRFRTLGFPAYEVVSRNCTIHLFDKSNAWPGEALPTLLASEQYGDWQFYFQELLRARHEVAVVPPHRAMAGESPSGVASFARRRPRAGQRG